MAMAGLLSEVEVEFRFRLRHDTELTFRLSSRDTCPRRDGHDTAAPPTAPLRADARRNRERILAAAATIFAEQGVGAQMDDVARARRRRGRHGLPPLPDQGRADGALVAQHFEAIIEIEREALTIEDPWEAFATMIRSGAALMEADTHMRQAMLRFPDSAWEHARPENEIVDELGDRLIRRAQARRRAPRGLLGRRHADGHGRAVREHRPARGPTRSASSRSSSPACAPMIARADALPPSPPSASTSSWSAAASRAPASRSTPRRRGYSVALVEKADFASGTSSRSSKLVHGGLRYLQNFDLGLVREALLERQLMVALAPHLVRPLPLVVPAFGGARPDRLVGVGLNLYDVMSVDRLRRRRAARDGADGAWSPDRHRVITGDEVVELLPALAGARARRSGYLFYDCQTDDSRLVLTVLGEAERYGAVLRQPGCEVTDARSTRAGVPRRRARDADTGEEFAVAAANVVNATGVWADRLRPEELHDEAEVPVDPPEPRHAHHVVDHDHAAAASPARSSRRAAGARSSRCRGSGATLIGTTDNDYDETTSTTSGPPPATSTTCWTRSTRFFGTDAGARATSPGAYAGVRPLISTGDPKKSVDISRKAELYETSSGMITITGGKLTTWRRMAKMAVDRLVEREARDAPCRTHEIPLGQAVDPDDAAARRGRARGRLRARWPAATATPRTTCWPIAARARRAGAADRRPALRPTCWPRSCYAARREQARTVGDVAAAPHAPGAAGRPRLTDRTATPSRGAWPPRWRPSWAGTSAAQADAARPRSWPRRRRRASCPAADAVGADCVTFRAVAGWNPGKRRAVHARRAPDPGVQHRPMRRRLALSTLLVAARDPRLRGGRAQPAPTSPASRSTARAPTSSARRPATSPATGRARRLGAPDGGVDHVFVSRLVGGAFRRPSASTAASPPGLAARRRGGRRRHGRRGLRQRRRRLSTVDRGAGAQGYDAPQLVSVPGIDPSVDLSINGVAYATFTAGGGRRRRAAGPQVGHAFTGLDGAAGHRPGGRRGRRHGPLARERRRRRQRGRRVGGGGPRRRPPRLRAPPSRRAAGPRRRRRRAADIDARGRLELRLGRRSARRPRRRRRARRLLGSTFDAPVARRRRRARPARLSHRRPRATATPRSARRRTGRSGRCSRTTSSTRPSASAAPACNTFPTPATA